MQGITIRPATCDDLRFLEDMLYEALFVPPGMDPFPDTIIRIPAIARYVEEFGRQDGDLGFIAVDGGGTPVGAAWVRRWDPAAPGYGYVDPQTPEGTIAVVPERRGEGIGSLLLEALVAASPRMSLSVDDRSRAVALYERFGFATIEHEEHSLLMLRDG